MNEVKNPEEVVANEMRLFKTKTTKFRLFVMPFDHGKHHWILN